MIILLGGASKRMGKDKAALELGNETLLYRLVRRAAQWTDHVVLAGRPGVWEEIVPQPQRAELGRRYPALVVDEVPDAYAGKGPVAGLEAGLRQAHYPYSGLVACDMPFASGRLMRHLCRMAVNSGADAVVPRWQGRLQPTHAVYHKNCLTTLEQKLKADSASVSFREWLSAVERLCVLTETELPLPERDGGRCFFNMNSPDDYKLAVTWVKKG